MPPHIQKQCPLIYLPSVPLICIVCISFLDLMCFIRVIWFCQIFMNWYSYKMGNLEIPVDCTRTQEAMHITDHQTIRFPTWFSTGRTQSALSVSSFMAKTLQRQVVIWSHRHLYTMSLHMS